MTEHIKVTLADGIMTLVMDRPEKKNALTDAMYGALAEAMERAQTDPEVRVVLIRGEGDAFTAGNDIADFAATAASGLPVNATRFLRALATARKPLVAAVQGLAVGIGTTMLLHCDHIVLTDDARLVTPFVNLGLVPEAAASLLLPARIGYARAFAMFALGDAVSASDALAYGLANTVVAASELLNTASDVAHRLAERPLGALIATKALMRSGEAMTAHMDVEFEEFAKRLRSAEAQEAFAAFAERRPPDFRKFAS